MLNNHAQPSGLTARSAPRNFPASSARYETDSGIGGAVGIRQGWSLSPHIEVAVAIAYRWLRVDQRWSAVNDSCDACFHPQGTQYVIWEEVSALDLSVMRIGLSLSGRF